MGANFFVFQLRAMKFGMLIDSGLKEANTKFQQDIFSSCCVIRINMLVARGKPSKATKCARKLQFVSIYSQKYILGQDSSEIIL